MNRQRHSVRSERQRGSRSHREPMRVATIAVGVMVPALGCSSILGVHDVTGASDANVTVDSPPAIDAAPCPVEDFNGDVLADYWMKSVGNASDVTVSNGKLNIAKAYTADTPSKPSDSWIYDLDTDKGNQIVWSLPIGAGDFDVTFSGDWATSDPDVWLGGVGVTSSTDLIEAWAGFRDGGTSSGAASVFAAIRVGGPGQDATFVDQPSTGWSGQLELSRSAGIITVRKGGVPVLTQDNAADIRHVVIVCVLFATTEMNNYTVGSMDIDQIAPTWSSCAH